MPCASGTTVTNALYFAIAVAAAAAAAATLLLAAAAAATAEHAAAISTLTAPDLAPDLRLGATA